MSANRKRLFTHHSFVYMLLSILRTVWFATEQHKTSVLCEPEDFYDENFPTQQFPVSHASLSSIIAITHSSVCIWTGLMGGHQSSFNPPPEGSAKCSLDLRALPESPVVQRLHLIPPTNVPQSCVYLCSAHSFGMIINEWGALAHCWRWWSHPIRSFLYSFSALWYLVGLLQLWLSDSVGWNFFFPWLFFSKHRWCFRSVPEDAQNQWEFWNWAVFF